MSASLLVCLARYDGLGQFGQHFARMFAQPRDAPPRLLIDKVAAGELGVKAGRGFYRYPHPAYQDPAWRLGEADDVTADVTQEGADQ